MKHSLLYSLSHEHSKMALISGTFMILKYTPAATSTTTPLQPHPTSIHRYYIFIFIISKTYK